MNSHSWPEKIIEYSFYALFLLVPLIWLPVNSELFEFNKMILVYLAASVVLTAWLFKSATEKTFVIKRTPLDIPIALFLLANLLSSLFSIDRHTSIFGYYSRFNGGLLSTIAYLVLYYALVTFFNKERLFRALKILLFSSIFVVVYAILQHPTPIFRNPDGSFRGIDVGYWQQDAESRVFSTFGHANWLAAFLTMLTPIAFLFLVFSRTFLERLSLALLLIGYFFAFTFTYSRGGTVGFIAMLAVLIAGTIFVFRDKLASLVKIKYLPRVPSYLYPTKIGFFLLFVLAGWLVALYFFGNAFITRGVNIKAVTAKTPTAAEPALTSNVGTETGKLRLIVWGGTWEIFKHFPFFGSGLETFTFSYYKFRPVEQNLTGDWDVLYNKAHNEFLNYLATTGAFGFFTYLTLIITFVLLVLIYLGRKPASWQQLFAVSVLASSAGYHAQNVFGFSVVAIALLFYLLPGFFFIVTDGVSPAKIPLTFLKKPSFSLAARVTILAAGLFLILGIGASWLADYYYNKGVSSKNSLESYQNLKLAGFLRPDEPLYKANLGLATISLALNRGGAERKAKIAEGFTYLNQATNRSPANISIWHTRLSAIYQLSNVDKQYLPQAVHTAEKLAELAPTEPEIGYNLAVVYGWANQLEKAQKQLERVVDLKFNYRQAWELLISIDQQLKDGQALEKHTKEFEKYFPPQTKQKQ